MIPGKPSFPPNVRFRWTPFGHQILLAGHIRMLGDPISRQACVVIGGRTDFAATGRMIIL